MATSLNANLNVTLNPASLASSSKQIQHALGRITGQSSEFQKSLDASTARVFAFGATTAVINGVSQSFKKLVATTIEVEKRLIEINSIFQASEATFNKFRNSIFKVAKETGQSFNTVADGAAELARQGLSAEETASRLKASLVLTRISGLDAAKSVKALTAAINGFASAGLNANQIVNKMVAVDTAFAVSTQDLAEAFSRAGSTAEDAGVSFNELLGLVTAVEQRTARGGAVIGNAFKSIFTRISRGSTIEKLKELGVEIDATQTGIQKLNALSAALQNVSDPTIASQIKELAGGVFQINVVSAALKDLSSETSIFAKAAATASAATNEAFEKNAELSGSISSQINVLIQGLTSLSERIGTITFGPLLQNLLGLTTKFTEFLDTALDPEKGNVFIKGLFKAIGSFLSGPAVIIFTAAFVKIFKLVAKFAGEGLKSLFAVGTQTERIRSIEGGIVGLLQRDDVLRQTILSSTVSQAQKEQAVISAIQKENRELVQQAALMRKIASAAAARGVSGFNPMTGSFRGKRGKGFASGFMEEEATAKMLGAPDNVQAHFGKGTIGGSRFVMNDNEVEIPNFAGGSSAVIPMYAGGNMPKYAVGRLSKSPSQIAELPQGKLNQFTNTQKYRDNADGATKSAVAARQKALNKDNVEDVVQINPQSPPTAMLIPNIGVSSSIPTGTRGRFNFKGRRMGFEYESGLAVEGPKVPRAVDQAADPHDEKLKKNITRSVTTNAANFSGLLKPILGKPSPQKILQKLKKQGGGKGALKGIVGAAFEASVNAALDISPARRIDGGDFDVKNAKGGKGKAVRGLFGVKNANTEIFDYKQAKGGGAPASFAKKIANEDFAQKRFKTRSRPKRRNKNYAGGYMPKLAKGSLPAAAPAAAPASGRGMAGMGGMGLMGGLMAMQTIVGVLNSSFQNSATKINDETNKRIDSIKASGREYTEITKLTKALEGERKAREGVEPALVKFAKNAELGTSALMMGSTLNLVTGGKAGAIGKKILGVKKAISPEALETQKKAKIAENYKRNRLSSGVNAKTAHAAAKIQQKAQAKVAKKVATKKMLGNAAGKLAIPVSLGLGLKELYDTYSDKSLEDSQKNERYKSSAGGMAGGVGGALTGAAIGTAILPVIGTAVGGIVGGIIGGLGGSAAFGDADTEDRNVRMRKEESGREAQHFGRLDFTASGFQEAVNKNLNKVNSEKGFEAAEGLENNYKTAFDELHTLIDNQKKLSPEDKTASEEEYKEKRAKAEKFLNKATMKLAGRRFLLSSSEAANKSMLDDANGKLAGASEKLANARARLEKETLDVGKRIKGDQYQGQIRNSMAGSISGPLAGAVGLASEQNLMFRDINAAKFEKEQANANLFAAQEGGSSEEKLDELNKAAMEAGAGFRKAVTDAAVSFKNKMVSLEKDILSTNKQKTQLQDKENNATESFIQRVASGEKGGSVSHLMDSMAMLEGFMKKMERKRAEQSTRSTKYKMNPEEIKHLARLKKNVEQGGSAAGLSQDSSEIIKILKPKLDEILNGNSFMGIKAQAKGVVDYSPVDKLFGKGKGKELREGEYSEEKGIQELDKKIRGLQVEMGLSEESFKRLNDEGSTKRLAENVTKLADEMQEAAKSVEKLNEFSGKMTTTVINTNGLITSNALFVAKQENLILQLGKKIEWLEEQISKLGEEGD